MVRRCGDHRFGFGYGVFANLIVQRKVFQRAGLAYLGLLASLLVGYVYACNHEMIAFSSPLASLMVSCVLLTILLFFSGIVFRL